MIALTQPRLGSLTSYARERSLFDARLRRSVLLLFCHRMIRGAAIDGSFKWLASALAVITQAVRSNASG